MQGVWGGAGSQGAKADHDSRHASTAGLSSEWSALPTLQYPRCQPPRCRSLKRSRRGPAPNIYRTFPLRLPTRMSNAHSCKHPKCRRLRRSRRRGAPNISRTFLADSKKKSYKQPPRCRRLRRSRRGRAPSLSRPSGRGGSSCRRTTTRRAVLVLVAQKMGSFQLGSGLPRRQHLVGRAGHCRPPPAALRMLPPPGRRPCATLVLCCASDVQPHLPPLIVLLPCRSSCAAPTLRWCPNRLWYVQPHASPTVIRSLLSTPPCRSSCAGPTLRWCPSASAHICATRSCSAQPTTWAGEGTFLASPHLSSSRATAAECVAEDRPCNGGCGGTCTSRVRRQWQHHFIPSGGTILLPAILCRSPACVAAVITV